MTAQLLQTTGSIKTIEITSDHEFTIGELETIVNGPFELIKLDNEVQYLIVNQEATKETHPFNRIASEFFMRFVDELTNRNIYGEAMLCDAKHVS